VAVLRCTEQGNAEALDAARDLLEDVAPRWLLVVGIAGGVPSDDFTLGDVVVSTRIHDFSVEAVLQDRAPQYALAGGPLHKTATALAADLPARKARLAGWSAAASIGVDRPPIKVTKRRSTARRRGARR
jgi:nucleoside phosphorylase